MSHAAELANRIQVIHRETGFLRLELPPELCGEAAAAAIEAGLSGQPGLRSAAVDRKIRRISLRYDASVVSTAQVARLLFGLLDGLPQEKPAAEPAEPETVAAPDAEGGLFEPVLKRAREWLAPADVPADSLQGKLQPVLASALTEKAIINFFNDLVAFYLVKAHWDLITKRWIKQPLAYSNAWMTIFYLVFLLVRYRKSNAGK